MPNQLNILTEIELGMSGICMSCVFVTIPDDELAIIKKMALMRLGAMIC